MMQRPYTPDPAEIAQQAIDYAAECAAQNDSRYKAIVEEKKAAMKAGLGTQGGPQTRETVKMKMSGPIRKRGR